MLANKDLLQTLVLLLPNLKFEILKINEVKYREKYRKPTRRRHVGIRMRRIVSIKMMREVSSCWIVIVSRSSPWNLGLDSGGGGGSVEPAGGRGRGGVLEEQGGVLGLEPRGCCRGGRVRGCQVLH